MDTTKPQTTLPALHPLSAEFFGQDTVQVAQRLLGHLLVVRMPDREMPQVLRIVETEAYTQDDPACHGYGRTTGRAAILYRQPGLAYVYFIYGMYYCLNVTTEPEGRAGAVLFRALEPINTPKPDLKTHGPGRLTRALGITRDQHNAVDMTDSKSLLYLAEGEPFPEEEIVQTTRIGIRKGADLPWRFLVRDNPWVSVPPAKASQVPSSPIAPAQNPAKRLRKGSAKTDTPGSRDISEGV